MTDLTSRTASQIRSLVATREVTCTEVARAFIARAEELNPHINALLTLDADGVLAEAAEQDARLVAGGDVPPLAGVPVAVKDNLCTRGLRTTCGSALLGGYVPPYDATAVARLRAAGAVVLGKANLDEFAMGSSTENSAFGPTRNPWDPSRVPGGSSGGSAAAVASSMAPIALGSDTGGSVKQPASLCGVVGLRPTYGRVSRYGLVAFASSLDQVGPLARTVEDAFLALTVLSGADGADATCADLPPLPPEPAGGGVEGLRVGLAREHLGEGLSPGVREAVLVAARALEDGGAAVEEVSLPHSELALAAYYVLCTAEASSNLARYDGVRYGLSPGGASAALACEAARSAGFGPEVKRRVLLGTFVLSEGYREAYYLRALAAREAVARGYADALGRVDLLLGPTSPTTAFPLGERSSDPVAMYRSDLFTVPANLAGLPGLSLPCGFDGAGLPIGAQLVAGPFREDLLFRAARHIEGELGLADLRPPDPRRPS